MKLIRKRFDIQVSAEGEEVKEDFELEKTVKKVRGIALTSDRDDLLFYRGSQKIEVAGTEVFPEGYESKMLMTGISLDPNKRYYEVDLEPGNGIVSIRFQDTAHANAPFVAYRVSLYIEAEV